MATREDIKGVYAITASPAPPAAPLLAAAEAALAGGVRVLQYRDKSADSRRRLAEAKALAAVARRHGATFIVNDDVELARSAGADGVHLGREDEDIARARAVLGADALIGVSCYNELARAQAALRRGADYVAFGSVFVSATKPDAPRAPLELLRAAVRRLPVPVVAIGGINATNAAQVVATGVDAIAVLGAVFDAPDATVAARALTAVFENGDSVH